METGGHKAMSTSQRKKIYDAAWTERKGKNQKPVHSNYVNQKKFQTKFNINNLIPQIVFNVKSVIEIISLLF